MPTHELPTLESALDFDANDLAANREGSMTQRQRDWQLRKGMRTIWWVLLLVLVVDAYFVFRIVGALNRIGSSQSPEVWLFGILADAAIVVLSIVFVVNMRKKLRADLQQGEVKVVRGTIKLRRFPYGFSIGGLPFSLRDNRALSVFRDGEHYRIYYAPHSKTVLSAEVDDGAAR